MVHIHGGGLSSGSDTGTSSSDRFVREQDVVLVGVNHRLNVFGYTYLGAFSSKYAVGNVGQLDLVAAPQWVRRYRTFRRRPSKRDYIRRIGGARSVRLWPCPKPKGFFTRRAFRAGRPSECRQRTRAPKSRGGCCPIWASAKARSMNCRMSPRRNCSLLEAAADLRLWSMATHSRIKRGTRKHRMNPRKSHDHRRR